MTSVVLEAVPVPFRDDAIQVVSVGWRAEEPILVEVLSKRSGRRCEVHFPESSGMRVLGELDLASFWMGQPARVLQSTWLFVVRRGGWFDLEATRQDFYTQHEAPVVEYLVAGYEECVSVLSRSQPKLEEVSRAADA
jgi:hypothetical protein